MDGTEKLRQHIDEKTQAGVAAIISDARQYADAILAEARSEADRIRDEFARKTEMKVLEAQKQQTSMQSLQARRVELQKKQDLLQDTLEKAKEKLFSADAEARKSLYVNWLNKMQSGEQTIRVAQADWSWFPDFIKQEYPGLVIEKEAGDFLGGFILSKGKALQDLRFETIFEQEQQKYLEIAARILFPNA